MYLSELDFGDNLRIIVCPQCSRSISVESAENGALMWNTMQVINQGDFFALHNFSTFDDNSKISINTTTLPG
jgi:exo-beta-1,3-glucanase (GH17 family)